MSIDTITPRSRRAILAGAIGGALASVGLIAKPDPVRAGTDGDVVLDDVNTGAGTTEIDSTVLAAAFKATGGGIGVVGLGPSGITELSNFATGVYGSASGAGVLGQSADGFGVFGHSDNLDGVYAQGSDLNHPDHTPNAGLHGNAGAVGVIGSAGSIALTALPDPIDAHTGVYGVSDTGHGVYGAADSGTAVVGASASGLAVHGTSNSSNAIRGHGALDGVIGESGGDKTGVVGFSGAGTAPQGPAKTGVYGEATQDGTSRGVLGKSLSGAGVRGEATSGVGVQGVASTGQAIRGDAGNGFAIDGTSSGGSAVRGHGQLDGVIGESAGGRSGVVGFSGAGAAPAGPVKTGVYGEATQDTAARGVHGKTTVGQGVRGEATTGVGVQAVATTGVALAVSGRMTLSRSGRATIAAGKTYVDVTPTGGLTSTAIVFAQLQILRTGVHVVAVKPNWPTTGKLRIYLSKAPTSSTPIAWMVIG